MALQLRILLDTNILIPLQDSLVVLQPNLAHVHQLCNGRHQLLYHPASRRDIQRDNDAARRARTLRRLDMYSELPEGPACPWNVPGTSENDKCDNSILFALERDATHVLVTEDRGLHRKALARNLASRVYFIQTIEDLLSRLHEPAAVELPDIVDVELNELTPHLADPFFLTVCAVDMPVLTDGIARRPAKVAMRGSTVTGRQTICRLSVFMPFRRTRYARTPAMSLPGGR